MINGLVVGWLKVKKYRTFWVLAGLFLLLLPIWNYGLSAGILKFGGGKNGLNFLAIAYSFPEVWGHVGFWGSFFVMFLSFLVIILTTNEYTFRTNRQNVIDGWSRMQFFHAKVGLVVVLSAIATAYLFIVGLIFGFINSGSISSPLDDIYKVGYFFLLSLNYMGFGLFLAIWIRKSGLAIGLFLMYSMFLEHMVYGIINRYTSKPWGNLAPLQTSDELLPMPWTAMAKSIMSVDAGLPMRIYVLGTICWCIIYYLAGRFMLMKRDW